MYEHEFKNAMQGLAEGFGKVADAKYARMVERWFRKFERLDSQVVRAAFDIAEASEDRFPSLSRLIEYARIENERRPTQKNKGQGCDYCDGIGVVRACDVNGYKPIFRCPNCDNCKQDYPVWSVEWERKGYCRMLPVVWDENDQYQVKGLALLGPDSIPWKKATETLRAKAQKLIDDKWKPKAGSIGEALTTKEDTEKERLREKVKWEDKNRDELPF